MINCVTCTEKYNKDRYENLKGTPAYKEMIKKQAENLRKRMQDPQYRAARNSYYAGWRDQNPDKVRQYERTVRATNPNRMIRDRLQSRIKFVLNNAGNKKSSNLESYIGCTSKDLVVHIESFYSDSVNWDTRNEWDIDHIRPCASFDLANDDQVRVCFNWRNLMPLDKYDNYAKGDTYEPHDEVEWAYMMRQLGYDGELFLLFEEGHGGLKGLPAD